MGFFKAFGAPFGKYPGEAPGNERYLPVTILDLDPLREEARKNYERVQVAIERLARQLAEVLSQNTSRDLVAALAFSMTELFRNVLEHSRASQIGYCAQYWPSKDVVEVGVLDVGRGLRAALSDNPHLGVKTDSHAAHLAILPGVSGTAFDGAPPQPTDDWANSGYGLYMTSGICREAGSFFICSGNAGLKLKGDHKSNYILDFPGTAIRLRFSPSQLPRLSRLKPALLRKGEDIASRIRGAILTPSVASQMVRERVT